MMLLELNPQCCDANDYIDYGKACAESGECYDKLRPMGSIYWFSLPFRLGFTENALIPAHITLAFLSILISFFAIKKIIIALNPSFKWRARESIIIALGNTIIHAIFLYPVYRHSLSDPPASLFFLMGTWSTMHYLLTPKSSQALFWVVISGLCFGLAAWIRVFFLYPVIFIMAIYTLIWLKYRGPAILLPFMIAIPLAIQVLAVHARTGVVAYGDPVISAAVKKLHMEMDAVGYDTYLAPKNSWGTPKGIASKSSCENYQPPSVIIKTLDIYSLTCIVTGRINFYLGSYGDRTYYINNLDILKNVNIFSDKSHVTNFIITSVPSPEPTRNGFDKKHSIEATLISKTDPSQSSEAFDVLWLDKGLVYSFAMWVWSTGDEHHLIEFFIRDAKSKKIISESSTIISPYPNLADTLGKIESSGFYEVGIKSIHYEPGTVIAEAAKKANIALNAGSFYAWNPHVLMDIRDPWNPANPNESNLPKRTWSYGILLLNLLSLVIATVVLMQIIQADKIAGTTLATSILLVCAMCIAVVPEQRFAIAPMIAIWQLCILGIILHAKSIVSKINPWFKK